jgi:predicted outer membrane lipoprotein
MEVLEERAGLRRRVRLSQARAVAGLLLACAFSGGVHVALAPEHLEESLALGAGFLAAGALLLGLGIGIYMRPGSATLALLIALLSGALIAAYAASRTVGLPLLHSQAEPLDAVGVTTNAVEVAAVALSLRLSFENAAGPTAGPEKERARWITSPPVRRAGS